MTDAVVSPQEIRTVEHIAWQCKGFNIPKALNQQIIEMFKNRIAKKIIEYCQGFYRNFGFSLKSPKRANIVLSMSTPGGRQFTFFRRRVCRGCRRMPDGFINRLVFGL